MSQPRFQPRQLLPSLNKRKVIDLTLSDDDEIVPIPRKKSRSSSQSTDLSAEPNYDSRKNNKVGVKQCKICPYSVLISYLRYVMHYDVIFQLCVHYALWNFSNISRAVVPTLKSTNSNGTVSAPRRLHFASKSTKVREKAPVFRSSYSQATSLQERVSAVQVPPLQPSPADCRRIFLENLSVLKGVTVVNTVDDSSPPLGFKFIKENVIGKGVHRATDEFMSGCTCRKDNGRQIGCEYLVCECLEDSATTKDGKKMFPYSARKIDSGCLRPFYLQGGFHVFECNEKCNCMSNCKNRVVQHGRTVPLEIFKTTNRGWGKSINNIPAFNTLLITAKVCAARLI